MLQSNNSKLYNYIYYKVEISLKKITINRYLLKTD